MVYRDTYDAFFRENRDHIVALISYHGAKTEDVEDIWQQFAYKFMRCRGLEKYNAGLSSINTFLTACIRNAVLDHAKHNARHQHDQISERLSSEESATHALRDFLSFIRWYGQGADYARKREIKILKQAFMGKSVAEIARRYGLKKSRIYWILKRIKRYYKLYINMPT